MRYMLRSAAYLAMRLAAAAASTASSSAFAAACAVRLGVGNVLWDHNMTHMSIKGPLDLLALNAKSRKHGACICTLLRLCGQLEIGLGRVSSI